MSSRTKVLVVLAAVAVLVLGGGLWWYQSQDAPAKVSLESAKEGVEPSDSRDSSGEGSSTTGLESTVDGSWKVDAETGEFDYETATGSFAGFRIQEELVGVGSNEAVGRTGAVSGTMEISGGEVTSTEVAVELPTITTNESRRDDRVQEALQTDQFPTATFELTEPIELGAAAEEGSPVSTQAVGELTVHGVARPVELALDAQLVGETIVVVGTTQATLSEFGVTAPTAPVILSVSDTFTVELQLLFVRS